MTRTRTPYDDADDPEKPPQIRAENQTGPHVNGVEPIPVNVHTTGNASITRESLSRTKYERGKSFCLAEWGRIFAACC